MMPRHVNLNAIMRNGKCLILACDQGFEHGPKDFNLTNIDPEFVMDLALEGKYTAVAVQAGIAEKYHKLHYKDIPLIVKLNGKTSFHDPDPWSRQHTSVDYAVKLGASAVGYTIYLGSKYENEQFVEFGKIVEEAHSYGLPVILWSYPRGSRVSDELATDVIAYGARVGLELGADVIKLKYNGDKEGFRWIIKNAGRAKVVISGGPKQDEKSFLTKLQEVMDAGAVGLAVGRNAWQHPKPYTFSKAIEDIIFRRKSVDEAMKRFDK